MLWPWLRYCGCCCCRKEPVGGKSEVISGLRLQSRHAQSGKARFVTTTTKAIWSPTSLMISAAKLQFVLTDDRRPVARLTPPTWRSPSYLSALSPSPSSRRSGQQQHAPMPPCCPSKPSYAHRRKRPRTPRGRIRSRQREPLHLRAEPNPFEPPKPPP